jgi:hypothetical protein
MSNLGSSSSDTCSAAHRLSFIRGPKGLLTAEDNAGVSHPLAIASLTSRRRRG